MRGRGAERAAQQGGDPLGQGQAAARRQVSRPSGPCRRSGSPAGHAPGGGGGGQLEEVAVRLPLGVPGAGRALVLLLGARQQGRQQPGGLLRADEHRDGGDGVCSCSASRTSAPPGCPRRAVTAAGNPRRPRPPRSGPSGSRPWPPWDSAAHARAATEPTSMIRNRSVCQGSGGSARPSSSAMSAFTSAPESPTDARVPAAPPYWTASRVPRTNVSHSTALSRLASQPAATTPKVVGTACWSSGPADHEGAAVGVGEPGRRRWRRRSGRRPARPRRPGRLSIAAVVHDVLACRPWCTAGPRRGVGDAPGQHRASPRHRVAGQRRRPASSARSAGPKLPRVRRGGHQRRPPRRGRSRRAQAPGRARPRAAASTAARRRRPRPWPPRANTLSRTRRWQGRPPDRS